MPSSRRRPDTDRGAAPGGDSGQQINGCAYQPGQARELARNGVGEPWPDVVSPGQNPTLRGRRLAMELQRRREATGMSREEVARQLEWSTSTLFRIETGRSRPQPGNVRTLLELYGVTGAERDGLIQLTREARQPGWWHSFRDVLPNPYEVYIGLEAGAASIRNFEPMVVPGLLQTADYAREIVQERADRAGP